MEEILKLVMDELRSLSPEALKEEIKKHSDSDIAVALREISQIDAFYTSHIEEQFSISLNEFFVKLEFNDFKRVELCGTAANDELFWLAA